METHETQLDKECRKLKDKLIHMAAVAERMIDQAVKELDERTEKFAEEMSDERERRSIGINLAFNHKGVIFPRFVEDDSLAWGDVKDSKNCPSQGFFN